MTFCGHRHEFSTIARSIFIANSLDIALSNQIKFIKATKGSKSLLQVAKKMQ